MFASNVQRLILFGEMAQRQGRKICMLGRSLESHVGIARKIRRLNWPSDLLISAEQARDTPRDEVLVLAGGTQAERNSAMRRLASGIHPSLSLQEGDSVIMSSRAIPGNERVVSHMMNDLLRRGVVVHSRLTDPGIHTSGHAARAEQRRMIELCQPRAFVPVHGALHHLLRHAELARTAGVSSTAVVENGTSVTLDESGVRSGAKVPSGVVHVAIGGETLTSETLQTRAELGRHGIVSAVLALAQGRAVVPPSCTARGVPNVDGDEVALRVLAREIARAHEAYRPGRGLERSEWLRRALRRKVEEVSGTRPAIEIRIVELD
jgi:ribonuclease J